MNVRRAEPGGLAGTLAVVLVAGLAVLLAGCGGGSSSSPTAAATTGESTASGEEPSGGVTYPIVQTDQKHCYDDTAQIECPGKGEPFFGQDGSYRAGAPVSYTDNGDGTITDNSTGLMWQQDPGEKTTYAEAVEGAESFKLAGYTDWRLPTIKELYSLYLASGTDASTLDMAGGTTADLTPFIDTKYFGFSFGDESAGERVIDAQWTTSTIYKSIIFGVEKCFFGVNFADGRIKCYPTERQRAAGWYTYHVRDTGKYGINKLADDGDGTITDSATGLTWQQADSGKGMDWEAALDYCDGLKLGGAQDWRLPDIKELQSIVDYSRSPDTSNSAAIDPVFETSSITNEAGEKDYPFFWSSSTHINYPDEAREADYISFGRALGYQHGSWVDVHGAGAQRSDPKTGDAAHFPEGRGPQNDNIRIDNYARCVRGGVG